MADTTGPEAKGAGAEVRQSTLPPDIVEGRFESDVAARRSSLSPHAWQLVEELRADPRALLGEQFVDELRDSVRKSLTSRKRWWEASLLVALVPTLGGAFVATFWQAYSRHTDQLLAREQRSYDRRVSLRAAFDAAVQRQASALETVCVRSTIGSFQQLKRKRILEEERKILGGKLRPSQPDSELRALIGAVERDIEQSVSVEKEEVAILDKAYDVTVSERRVDSYVGELKAVFESDRTQRAADRFATAWSDLEAEVHAERVEEWRVKLRQAADASRDQARSLAAGGERLSREQCALTRLHRARKLACTQKADEVRAAYAVLSTGAASELQVR